MWRIKFIWLIISSFTISNSFGSSGQSFSKQEKNILVILAFSPTNPVYKQILDGIKQPLQEEFGDAINLHTEYLEFDRFPEDESVQKKLEKFNEKYCNINLDLLICVGVDAISRIKKYADNSLLNLPTINFDLDFSQFGIHLDKFLNEKTAYIGLQLNPEISISTALKIFPDVDTIFFISGYAKIDTIYREITKQVLQKKFQNRHAMFITDLSMDEILVKVSTITENNLITIASYNLDKKGLPFYSNDAIRMISRESNVPVISYSDLGFGEGSLGGRILNFYEGGLFTGHAAVKILTGTDPNSIQITEDDYYTYQYDWREIERWNIDLKRLSPKGYTLYYKDQTFLGKYKWAIIALFLFLFLQTMFIISLVISRRKQKILISQIRETEMKFRKFANEDRILRIGQLSASLSHELIQPLTSILSTAQAGVRFIDSNNYTSTLLKEILENIIEDDKRTSAILRSLMGMMKIEDREKEKINLNTLVEEVVTIFRGEAIDLNIKIVLQLNQNPVFIMADRVQIQQVILNFLLNAAQAMENIDDSKKTISITDSVDADNVTIAVSDNGKGVPKEIMNKLFKPFVTSKEKGLGIGLSICQTIIKDHLGKIWAEDLPEGGAKFSFSLKICKDGNNE